jgi:hypothetical protein
MSWNMDLYWLCHREVNYRGIAAGTLWRVNKTWLDNLLYRANPHAPAITNYTQDEEDRRAEIQCVHTGQLVELWTSTLLSPEHFTPWRPCDILIPEWNTGIIEFDHPDAMSHWKYDNQGVVP